MPCLASVARTPLKNAIRYCGKVSTNTTRNDRPSNRFCSTLGGGRLAIHHRQKFVIFQAARTRNTTTQIPEYIFQVLPELILFKLPRMPPQMEDAVGSLKPIHKLLHACN